MRRRLIKLRSTTLLTAVVSCVSMSGDERPTPMTEKEKNGWVWGGGVNVDGIGLLGMTDCLNFSLNKSS